VPDFPKTGIVFKDLMPLVADRVYFRETIDRLAEWARPREPDVILGAEARGFIFGGALAYTLGCGFVPARKPGKLPWSTVEARYELEYGTDTLEVHTDALGKGSRVIVLDDVLATGGTAQAKIDLVEQLGGQVVGALFVIELAFLHGRNKLDGYDVHALIEY
jgi:adenine phosphoribosyltransferase